MTEFCGAFEVFLNFRRVGLLRNCGTVAFDMNHCSRRSELLQVRVVDMFNLRNDS